MVTASKKELKALITLAGKVDPSVQAAMLKASNESAKCSSRIQNNFAGMGKKIAGGAAGLAKGIGTTFLALTAAALVAFTAIGAQGLSYASDLNEVQNVVDKTFSESAYVIDNFAETALDAFGLTRLEAKQFSGTMGTMLKSMGMADSEVLTMSQNMTALSGDMASFYNLSATEAFDKIRAGISGETEPLKQLGINMSVANLEAYALSQGVTTAFASMSQGDQALLRYNYLLQATADAQGDFADTSDSFANQQKLLQGNLKETAGEIMQGVMPALAGGLKELNAFMSGLDTEAIGAFVGSLANMAVGFLPLVMQLMPLFGDLLGLILPPLMEIGQMIMPILVDVIGTLMQALEPILPIFIDIVKMILPPIALLLQAIMPLISGLASFIGGQLSVAIAYLVELLTPAFELLKGIGEVIGKVGGAIGTFLNEKVAPLFGANNGKSATTALTAKAYANGGFASEASIFGEAGLEAAIPIRPGNARSLSLLQRTAQLLGVGQQTNNSSDDRYQFVYAPNIQGGDAQTIEPMLKKHSRQMRDMIDEYFAQKGRLAWE